MQSQRTDRQIETTQPQGRKPEDKSEQNSGERRSRERDPERRSNFAREDSGGECTGGNESCMTERDLSGITGQKHQRKCADRSEENLAGEVEREWRREKGKRRNNQDKDGKTHPFGAGPQQREVFAVAGVKITACARRWPKHGQAPRGCRTDPRGARPASQSKRGKARRRTAVDRHNR